MIYPSDRIWQTSACHLHQRHCVSIWCYWANPEMQRREGAHQPHCSWVEVTLAGLLPESQHGLFARPGRCHKDWKHSNKNMKCYSWRWKCVCCLALYPIPHPKVLLISCISLCGFLCFQELARSLEKSKAFLFKVVLSVRQQEKLCKWKVCIKNGKGTLSLERTFVFSSHFTKYTYLCLWWWVWQGQIHGTSGASSLCQWLGRGSEVCWWYYGEACEFSLCPPRISCYQCAWLRCTCSPPAYWWAHDISIQLQKPELLDEE